MGKVLGPFIRARDCGQRLEEGCRRGMEVGVHNKEVLASETQIFAFSRAWSRSGSRTLIQQDVKPGNFWEFLEIGLLPTSSYSYTGRICTARGAG